MAPCRKSPAPHTETQRPRNAGINIPGIRPIFYFDMHSIQLIFYLVTLYLLRFSGDSLLLNVISRRLMCISCIVSVNIIIEDPPADRHEQL